MATIGPFTFSGGYSPGYAFPSYPDDRGYLTIMENCKIVKGGIAPRWGDKTVSAISLGTTSHGLTSWNDTVNSKLAIVHTLTVNGTPSLYVGDASSLTTNGTLTMTDRTGALAAASLNGLTTFDSLNNILVGSANSASSGAVFKVTAYNANGAALSGSPPSCDIAKQCNNFMFLARNLSSTTTQSRVYWSNVNDPETWTAANALDFNKNDGEPIMALGSINTDLYIFKKSSIGRLSTVTISVSGAVTLGPLVTVVRGVGCCGPRALDNLPNGNIVFLGTDGHFYEFDGSTIIDRSRSYPPGPNVYDSGVFRLDTDSLPLRPNFGLGKRLASTTSNVKVCRGINEVWVTYEVSLTAGSGYQVYAYNYELGVWNGSMSNGASSAGPKTQVLSSIVLSKTTSTIQTQESFENFIYGDTTGQINITGNSDVSSPSIETVAGSVTARNFVIGKCVTLLDNNGTPFIPRSICFEVENPLNNGNVNITSLQLFADYDTYSPDTSDTTKRIFSISTQPATRNFANISHYPDTGNIFATHLALAWVGVGDITSNCTRYDGMTLGRFWLSDQVTR